MKKGLSILIAVAMVFAFTGNAMAADADCNVCKDNVVPGIQCPVDQGDAFCPFDYDSGLGLCDPSGRIIFDLCSCPESCRIEVGNILGVKIDILTPGVYFAFDTDVTSGNILNTNTAANGSTPANNQLEFSLFPKTKIEEACDANDHTPNNNWDTNDDPGRYFGEVAYYTADNLKTPIAPVPSNCIDKDLKIEAANAAKVMMVLKPGGYIINNEDADAKLCQMWINVPRMIVNPAEYTNSMAGQEIKIRISAFTETQNADGDLSNQTPTVNALNFDKAWNSVTGDIVDVVQQSSTGEVRDINANLIWDPTQQGVNRIVGANKTANISSGLAVTVDDEWVSFARFLCPDCYAPCGCDFAVAKFCCEATKYGMLFPYFAPDNDESNFWNGFVISNLSVNDGIANITIYEMDGDVGEADVNVSAKGIYNSLLRNISGVTLTKTGTGDTAGTLGNSKAFMWVCTNFLAHGFAMLSDSAGMGESMGYLPVNSSARGYGVDRGFLFNGDGPRNGWNFINPNADKTIMNCE